VKYLIRGWDTLGGDGVIAALIDVALSEVKARGTYKRPITLLNAATGEAEVWCPLEFDYMTGQKEIRSWHIDDWPEGWPRPWEEKEEA